MKPGLDVDQLLECEFPKQTKGYIVEGSDLCYGYQLQQKSTIFKTDMKLCII